jgi:glycosyltransferase involved in cell wall biosynthesis
MLQSAAGLRILHVELGGRIVGGPQQVIYLLDGLRARGVENIVVAAAGAPLAVRLQHDRFNVHVLPWRGDADLSLLPKLLEAIRAERPDVVHLHAGPGAVLGALAAKLAGVPCVLSRRVDSVPKGRLSRWSYGALNDRIICISQAIFDVLRRFGVRRDRLVLIRSSVRAEDWQSPAPREAFLAEFALPAEALVIGVVAQLVPRKGHAYLFEAARMLGPRVRIVCFGEGASRGELEGKAAELGMSDAVRFAGHRNDLPRWMGNLDLVVHPATMEGLGVSLLQAASAGVPVVASAVGGIPEAILDGVTGRLVPPRDVAALGTTIRELLHDPARRAAMGQAARQRVLDEFDVRTMVDRHLALYRDLVRT